MEIYTIFETTSGAQHPVRAGTLTALIGRTFGYRVLYRVKVKPKSFWKLFRQWVAR